jgi:hypothetical protein
MTKSESLSTLRTGILAIAYVFLMINIVQIFLDWNSSSHEVIDYAVLVVASSIILIISWSNNIFGAISYSLLLGYVYGFEALIHDTAAILYVSPAILLAIAWLVY